jgi:hypothetical protein
MNAGESDVADQSDAAVERVLADMDALALILAELRGAVDLQATSMVSKLWATVSRDERVWQMLYVKRWGAHMLAEPPLLDLRMGDLAELHGLVSRPELNGRTMKLMLWLEDAGRWAVQAEDNQIKVRPQNLTGTWRQRYLHRARWTSKQYVECSRAVSCRRSASPVEDGVRATAHQSGYFRGGDVLQSLSADADLHQTCRATAALMPLEDNLGYFEVYATGSSVGLTAGGGYSVKGPGGGIHLGWRKTSYGYHSDDGSKWRNDDRAQPALVTGRFLQGDRFAEPFGKLKRVDSSERHDVVGCGVDYNRGSIFFTKNGKLMGIAFEDVRCCTNGNRATGGGLPFLIPTVTLHEREDECSFNFGGEPFLFDLLAFGRSEERHGPVHGGGVADVLLPDGETEMDFQVLDPAHS